MSARQSANYTHQPGDTRPPFHVAVMAEPGLTIDAGTLYRRLIILLRDKRQTHRINFHTIFGEPLSATLSEVAERFNDRPSATACAARGYWPGHMKSAVRVLSLVNAAVWFCEAETDGARWLVDVGRRVGVPVRIVRL
ncbi:hypothetical protein [Fimbriiglobus ruber]|uniref:Uncharacterized protein n=1 Tax=Fimbriiglobus ruber TaxID=1908690 RepID=A0A225DDP5_9BACT|nr:hypothetical protein [Fimbriiglobus ruber]OWK34237.1 hypothetical protein FRUB_10208 [Fimbriiglobus ruber]